MAKKTPQTTSPASTLPAHRSVTLATPADLPFVVHLQKLWSNNLGFLPRVALAEYINSKQLLLVRENGQAAGYLNWTCTKAGMVRIPQVALEPELLRTTVGSKIMAHLKRAAVRGDCSVIRLTSRSDLPANLFWPTLGFNVTAVYANPTKRNLPLFEWTMPLLSPDLITQGLMTGGKAFRPMLRHRSKPDIRSHLITADAGV